MGGGGEYVGETSETEKAHLNRLSLKTCVIERKNIFVQENLPFFFEKTLGNNVNRLVLGLLVAVVLLLLMIVLESTTME